MESSNKSSSYKWVILAVFAMISAINSILFISFAPLNSFVQNKYGVSEFSASTLVMIFPLLSIIISFPCGVMADKFGYKSTMRLGCILIAAFACLRVYDGSFKILFIGQLGIAIGTPFVINTTAKVMGDWFKDKEIAFANGIASCGLFVGMALGMGLAPILVGFMGFQQLMALHAGIAIIGAIIVIVLIREKHRDVAPEEGGSWAVFVALIKNPNLRIIFILGFIAAGYFNGLTTWLEPMLSVKGISAKQAGLVGASLILGGIIGSVIMPAMSDRYGKRKPFIMLCCLTAALSTYPLCTGTNFKILLILGVSVGGFFFPGYPLMLSLLKEIAGAKRTGMAMGIFSIVGNFGGTVLIILMEAVKKAAGNTWTYSIYMLIAILGIALLITTRLKEPRID